MDKLPLALDFFSAISCRFPGGRVETKVLLGATDVFCGAKFLCQGFSNVLWFLDGYNSKRKVCYTVIILTTFYTVLRQIMDLALFKTNWMSNNFLTELSAAKRIGSKLGRSWS